MDRKEAGRLGGLSHTGRVRVPRPGGKTDRRREAARLKVAIEESLEEVMGGVGPADPGTAEQKALRVVAAAALDAAASAKYSPGQLARALCEMQLLANVAFWTKLRDNPEAQDSDRLRASENLANRGGLPTLTQSELKVDQTKIKLVDVAGDEPGIPLIDQPPPPETEQ